METITAPDGVPIAYTRTGDGPPLVFVHGTSADHMSWHGVRPTLESCHTFYAIDRRGRGESGDTSEYTVAQEFRDVAAVVDSIEAPVALFGHSFGALCALNAAQYTDNLSTLILYEPTIDVVGTYFHESTLAEMESLLAEGNNEAALEFYLREVIGLPEAALDSLRAADSWSSRVAAAYVLPREYLAPAEYSIDATTFESVTVPTLLLVGSESPQWGIDSTATVADTLPNCQVRTLEGQGHLAYATAPDLFTEVVNEFLQNGVS